MEDFLLSLLAMIAELFAEVFLNALLEISAGAFVALISRATRRLSSAVFGSNRFLAPMVFALLGIAAGFLSVLIFPHRLVHPSRFHGISLLISPIITGLVMSQVGRAVRRRGQESVEIESFGYGFTFALAMAIVRLTLVK
jgi:hypothetical protein